MICKVLDGKNPNFSLCWSSHKLFESFPALCLCAHLSDDSARKPVYINSRTPNRDWWCQITAAMFINVVKSSHGSGYFADFLVLYILGICFHNLLLSTSAHTVQSLSCFILRFTNSFEQIFLWENCQSGSKARDCFLLLLQKLSEALRLNTDRLFEEVWIQDFSAFVFCIDFFFSDSASFQCRHQNQI